MVEIYWIVRGAKADKTGDQIALLHGDGLGRAGLQAAMDASGLYADQTRADSTLLSTVEAGAKGYFTEETGQELLAEVQNLLTAESSYSARTGTILTIDDAPRVALNGGANLADRRSVRVTNLSTSKVAYLGDVTVTSTGATQGFPLAPGGITVEPYDDSFTMYAICATGESLSLLVEEFK